MLYMYKVVDGFVHIQSAKGLFPGELKRYTDDGWITYWTTDRNAGRDGHRFAGIPFS